MKKIFLVVGIVMLASLIASAQLVSPTVYDRHFVGYCDGAHLVLQKLTSSGVGSTKVYIAGYHDLATSCGGANSAVVGNKAGAGFKVPPRSITATSGPVFYTADNQPDARCLCFSGNQWSYVYDVANEFSSIYEAFLGFDGDYFCCSQSLSIGLTAQAGERVSGPSGGAFRKPE